MFVLLCFPPVLLGLTELLAWLAADCCYIFFRPASFSFTFFLFSFLHFSSYLNWWQLLWKPPWAPRPTTLQPPQILLTIFLQCIRVACVYPLLKGQWRCSVPALCSLTSAGSADPADLRTLKNVCQREKATSELLCQRVRREVFSLSRCCWLPSLLFVFHLLLCFHSLVFLVSSTHSCLFTVRLWQWPWVRASDRVTRTRRTPLRRVWF